MRILNFIIDGQIIKQDPNCDFDNLVPGTEGYLLASFTFSKEWVGHAKVATFWSIMGREYPPQLLTDGKTCVIPAEALKRRVFKVQVIGKDPCTGTRLMTNKVAVSQNGGKA